jgi:nucleoid-associated protein YgaU
MPVRPLAVEEQPVPTPSPATLGQPIPTNTEPAWPAANEAPFARTVEPSGPAWPAAAPTLRDGSLFADPPAAANTAFIPDRSPAPTAASSDNLYTVRPGDNYWVIAKAHYGSVRYFAALTEYNRQRVVDPQKMKPGVQVAIPEASVLESQFPHLFTGPVPSVAATRPTVNAEGPGQFFVSAGEPMYRVGQGDTLSSISQKHLGRASRWEQVFAINRDVLPAPDRLKPGLILRLPRDASQIAVTPEGSDGR